MHCLHMPFCHTLSVQNFRTFTVSLYLQAELDELDEIRNNLRAARSQRSIEKDNFSDDELES